VATAQFRHLRAGLRLFQDADDLLFTEPRSFCVCLPFRQKLTHRWDTWRGKATSIHSARRMRSRRFDKTLRSRRLAVNEPNVRGSDHHSHDKKVSITVWACAVRSKWGK
jgi:hypothetical protein